MMSNAIYRFGDEKIGYCTVLVRHPPHVEHPTPEQIAEVEANRRNLNDVLSKIESETMGRPMKVTVDFRDDLYCNGIPETLEDVQRIAGQLTTEGKESA